jgi:hypothetical protein
VEIFEKYQKWIYGQCDGLSNEIRKKERFALAQVSSEAPE